MQLFGWDDAAIGVELWPGHAPKLPAARRIGHTGSRRGVCRRDPPFSATEAFCLTGHKDSKMAIRPERPHEGLFGDRQGGRCVDSSFDCPDCNPLNQIVRAENQDLCSNTLATQRRTNPPLAKTKTNS